MTSSTVEDTIPFDEALSSPDRNGWMAAMRMQWAQWHQTKSRNWLICPVIVNPLATSGS